MSGHYFNVLAYFPGINLSIIISFSFGLTQKKQKVKALYKFYTSVRLGKGSQNKA
jgi:hypothetical protein